VTLTAHFAAVSISFPATDDSSPIDGINFHGYDRASLESDVNLLLRYGAVL